MRRLGLISAGLLFCPACWALPDYAGEALGWCLGGVLVLVIWGAAAWIDFKIPRLAVRIGSGWLLFYLVHRSWWIVGLVIAAFCALKLEEMRDEREGKGSGSDDWDCDWD